MTDNTFPIYADRTIGAKDLRDKELGDDALWVTSIFYTLQGEGVYAGYPAVFVRMAGCNRGGKGTEAGPGCQFCDTDFRFDRGTRLTVEEIMLMADRRIAVKATHAKWLAKAGDEEEGLPPRLMVITGGEPMLQPNLYPLIEAAHAAGWLVQMESNGDLMRVSLAVDPSWFYVVSPKINPDGSYPAIRPDVLDRLDCLKLLVSADPADPYHNLPDYLHLVQRDLVYISPITVYARAPVGVATLDDVDLAATRRNMAYAAELAMQHGYKLSLQTHVFLGIE